MWSKIHRNVKIIWLENLTLYGTMDERESLAAENLDEFRGFGAIREF